MDIFDGLTMIGGLAFFLYGMNGMEDGLSKLSGGRLEGMLERLTHSKLRAVLFGAVVTALIQSSSATTVMVVGLVNSGILKLSQAVGVIMGANVGTTITSWVLSLSGIESNDFLLKLLKPIYFSPILAAVGVVFILFLRNSRKKSLGMIFVGFAILMFGMDAMSEAVKPLADIPEFTRLFTLFTNPVLGLAAGAVLTAVIQSSSASIGILQALAASGSVTVGSAVPIIMGQNIGTCATALISSIGAGKNAKRAAFIHLYFNLVGTVLFMAAFYAGDAFFGFHFMDNAANAATIAMFHSIFNLSVTFVLLPFSRLLEKMAVVTIRDKEKEEPLRDGAASRDKHLKLLDERFLEKPGFALEHCRIAANRMAELAKEAVLCALRLLEEYSEKEAEALEKMEGLVDRYEDELGTYLMRVSKGELFEKEGNRRNILLHCIGDFERISDHAMNIMEAAKEIHDKNLSFSAEAAAELAIYQQALGDILDLSMQIFIKEDTKRAKEVEPLEETIDQLSMELKARHIKRLVAGTCTIELGFILSDITTNVERIADHCSNVAVCLIQMEDNGMEVHGYLENVKKQDHADFFAMVEENQKRYKLPAYGGKKNKAQRNAQET